MKKNLLSGLLIGFSMILVTPLGFLKAQSWSSVASGTQNDFTSIDFADDISGWICGVTGIIKNSTDGGASWISQTSNTVETLNKIDFLDGNTGWTVGNAGTILKSINGGFTWNAQVSNTTKNLFCVQAVNANIVFAGGESGTLLKTTDGGSTWTDITTSTLTTILGVQFLDGTTGWAIGTDINNNRVVAKSSNGGTSFTIQKTGGTGFYRAMQFLDVFVGYVVGDLNTVEKTSNGGQTWTTYNPNGSWQGVSFTGYNNGWISGADGKIMRTNDGALNWSPENTPTDKIIKDIFFYSNTLGWATGTYGTILSYNPGTGINTNDPDKAKLNIFPNPASGQVSLSYNLPDAGRVEFRILDLLGKEMMKHDEGIQLPGVFSSQLSLDLLPGGIYLVQLTLDGFNEAIGKVYVAQ